MTAHVDFAVHMLDVQINPVYRANAVSAASRVGATLNDNGPVTLSWTPASSELGVIYIAERSFAKILWLLSASTVPPA